MLLLTKMGKGYQRTNVYNVLITTYVSAVLLSEHLKYVFFVSMLLLLL